MMTEPMFAETPTFRNYEDYKYGKAWADGWNDAMEFIFAEEVESERSKQLRENFSLVTGNGDPQTEERSEQMIVIGYQGIGKSTLARKSFRYIDLESSAVRKDDMRWQNWYEPYCMIAEWLSRQGYTVFVSSHKEVRDYLNEFCEEPFCAVVPSENLKEEWIGKLRERHKQLPTDKNYRAYMNAAVRYSENIREIKKDVEDVREITSMVYELDKLIEKADTPQPDCPWK